MKKYKIEEVPIIGSEYTIFSVYFRTGFFKKWEHMRTKTSLTEAEEYIKEHKEFSGKKLLVKYYR